MSGNERDSAGAMERPSPAAPPAPEPARDVQERIYQAGFDAAMVWQCAVWLPAAFILSFVPIIWIVGFAGSLVLLVAVPGLVLRWALKYRRLDARDPDVHVARVKVARALAIWAIFAFLALIALYGTYLVRSGYTNPGGSSGGTGTD